jgi:hypothetical protein
MPDPSTHWQLEGTTFADRLLLWRRLESPPAEVLAVVEEWIPTRKLDPFRGARLEREEDDFWFAQIPGTLRDGSVVVCSYWIRRRAGLVCCDLFGTLSWPV